MTKKRTYYDILRVSPDAPAEVIKAAYRTLMSTLKMHPDMGGDEKEAAEINRAYEILSNPRDRVAYNSSLINSKEKNPAAKDNSEERRRVERKKIGATVSVCVDHDAKWYSAKVVDVSVLGVRLQAHTPLAVGDHLVIAPTNPAAVAIHGKVKWARMFHPSVFERVYEVGIEFSDQITDVIQRFSI